MSGLADRLCALEDRVALLDLEADYAAHWDFARAREWAELFSTDGSFEMLAVGPRPAFIATGHAELQAFCENIHRNWMGIHFMHPPRLRIAGDAASALIFFEFRHVYRGDGGHTSQGVVGGYYEAEYRRTGQGWRIVRRREQGVFESTDSGFDFRRGPAR